MLLSSTITEESTKDGELFIFPWKRRVTTFFLLEQGKWRRQLSGIPLWNISKSFYPVLFKVGALPQARKTCTKPKLCFFHLLCLFCSLAWLGCDQGCSQKLLQPKPAGWGHDIAAPHETKCPFCLLIPGLAVFTIPESVTCKPILTYMDSPFFIL